MSRDSFDAPEGQTITVWLVEDSSEYREAVKEMIDEAEGMRCARTFARGEDLLSTLNREPLPDVVLMDISLPGLDGVECVRSIRSYALHLPVIMLTIHSETDIIFNAICAGASGYLLKSVPNEKIIEAIREVVEGRAPINGQIAQRMLDLFRQRFKSKYDYQLSDREKEVLELLVEGYTKAQIADRLHLATHTIDSHTRSIYAKLHVNSAVAAAVKAVREGLV